MKAPQNFFGLQFAAVTTTAKHQVSANCRGESRNGGLSITYVMEQVIGFFADSQAANINSPRIRQNVAELPHFGPI